jgi:hypothetical protein
MFLVRNSTKQVFSKLSGRRLVVNQLFILVNITFMSFIKSTGFGLVAIRLLLFANRISLVLLLLSVLFMTFGK